MRKLVLASLALILSTALTVIAADTVSFVSFKDDKLTVKKDDKEVSYKVTDKTTFKFGDKEADAVKAKERLGKLKADTKFEIEVEKDTVTSIKFTAGKKKADKN